MGKNIIGIINELEEGSVSRQEPQTLKKKKKKAPKFLSCFYKLYPLQITENVEKKDKRQTD